MHGVPSELLGFLYHMMQRSQAGKCSILIISKPNAETDLSAGIVVCHSFKRVLNVGTCSTPFRISSKASGTLLFSQWGLCLVMQPRKIRLIQIDL